MSGRNKIWDLKKLYPKIKSAKFLSIPFRAHAQQNNLVSEDMLEEKYLFSGNNFQKSIDPKYLFEHTPTTNIILDHNGCLQGYNSSFKKFIVDGEISLGALFIDFLSPACQIDLNNDLLYLLNHQESTLPFELEFKGGKVAMAYFNKIEFPDLSRESSHKGYILQIFDNNEHKKFQQRLLQSQKLQALGQLAGGIAHDFNNLLTAMLGHCELLLLRQSPGEQFFTELTQIKQNTTRASNLVKQLLAFSRQQTLQPVVLDVGEVLVDLLSMLQRLINPSIELKIVHGEDLYFIKFDRGQFEQVIANLVINARDAIQGSGTIRLVTSSRCIKSPTPIGHETIQPGDYVQIEVIDDGCGIEIKNISRIFDPFFTTKEQGAGTGLGLSTVYGIIKQTEGCITVESTHNIGTRFIILLPKFERQGGVMPAIQDPDRSRLHRDLTGTGKILLVDDEDAVRLFAARALSDKGYTVIEARTGQDALTYLQSLQDFEEAPQLLITDVAMPKMDGSKLAQEAIKLYPNLKIIYASGYAEESFREQVAQEQQVQFLQKPFSLEELATKVREIFDEIEKAAPLS